MYSVIVAFCNVFAFFNVGLPCTLYFVLWLSIKVFVLKKQKKNKNKKKKEKILNILQEQFEAKVDTYLRISSSHYK